MVFWCDLKFEKGGGFEPEYDTFYYLRHQRWPQLTVFCNDDQPNHTMVGGVSVNILCHQGICTV